MFRHTDNFSDTHPRVSHLFHKISRRFLSQVVKIFGHKNGNDVSTQSCLHRLPYFSRLVSNQTYSVEIPFKTAGFYRFEATFHLIA